ncbi:hypothetical protein CHS0354_012097 [Potamilus streckersoni]|uniref:Uncharacterized protein n=1 Tax=Potamilus streckersoni TaxID=2493646 RepID=A0AAE0S9Z0_9BIVA|nr:hypothetical protein CHS0354_012097 [Potamilus streckersoni]
MEERCKARVLERVSQGYSIFREKAHKLPPWALLVTLSSYRWGVRPPKSVTAAKTAALNGQIR